MEKFLEYLETAEKKLHTVDHMAHVTFPLIKDKRLLLKILSELNLIVLNCINSVLQYDYLYKKIQLTKDAQTNLRIFKEKCAPRYGITEQELSIIINTIELANKHKKSPFEFIKNNKVVILSENLRTETITIEKIKESIISCKNVLKKVKSEIKNNF